MKIAREGLPVCLALVVVALAGAWIHLALGAALSLPALFSIWFFRDPERVVPDDPELLVSPADGKIIVAGPRRVSVFMNVFNVHVCRAPCGGRVEEVEHSPGRFLAAYHDAASEQNERVSMRVAEGPRNVRFTLVAGLVARRIVSRVRVGDRVQAGERIGLIRFGSRVDVDLPEGYRASVRVGQRVVAGVTPVAEGTPEVARRSRAGARS